MLNDKQKLTIKHLQEHQGITDPKEIVFYCIGQMNKKMKGLKKRRHSLKHYQGIINYMAQGKGV